MSDRIRCVCQKCEDMRTFFSMYAEALATVTSEADLAHLRECRMAAKEALMEHSPRIHRKVFDAMGLFPGMSSEERIRMMGGTPGRI